jgi:hypothetical protein
MFMRDGDGISPAAMAGLYDSFSISAELKDELETHRSSLNAFLDSMSRLAISDEGPLTYREILDIFVWGEYAHVDPGHRQTYEDLRTTPFFPMFQNCLVEAIVAFARCISTMRDTNRRAAAELISIDS